MLGKFLTVCFLATASLSSGAQPKVSTEKSFELGQEVILKIRSNYENGKFNEFMFDMDEAYKKADLKDFVEMRKKPFNEESLETIEGKIVELQGKKNFDLLEALKEDDQSIFAQKVRFLASNVLTQEQEKAVSKINSLVSKAPDTGLNPDENALIAIDLEYEYKLSKAETREKQIALRMEKMDKMLRASKGFKDASLKEAVEISHATLDARLARNLDGADLSALSKTKSSNQNEEVVYSVLRSYQGQFSDLIQTLR